MRLNKLSWICIGCIIALTGSSIWTWLEMERWLARSDVLAPFFSLGLSRFLNVVLYASGSFFLFLLLSLILIYRACREDARHETGRPGVMMPTRQNPTHEITIS